MGLNIRKVTANKKMLFQALKTIVEFNNFYGKRDWDNYGWDNVTAVLMVKGKDDIAQWFKITVKFENGDHFDYYTQLDYQDGWNSYSTSGHTGGDNSKFVPQTEERIVYLRQFAALMV